VTMEVADTLALLMLTAFAMMEMFEVCDQGGPAHVVRAFKSQQGATCCCTVCRPASPPPQTPQPLPLSPPALRRLTGRAT
jgi:hypothetical protein